MSKKVVEYLKSIGYNVQYDSIQCKLDDAEWVAYKRTGIQTKDCKCNDKPPRIAIVYHNLFLGGEYRKSYKVEIIQENDLGWVDLSFYGFDEDDILNNITEIEKRFVKALEVTWGAI